MAPNNNTIRIAGLDGLRGIAVALVMCHHLVEVYAPAESMVRTFSGGFIGVDLFFVISGFLITLLALDEYETNRHINVPHFYARRALRLIPALLFFLLIQIAFATFSGQLAQVMPSVWATLFYYLNWKVYFSLDVVPQFGHLWSLSVEEQYYMVWPLCLLLLLRWRITIPVLLLTVLAVAIHRNRLWHETGNWLLLYLRTDMRLDTLLLGALCAFLWQLKPLAKWFIGGFAGSVLLFLLVAMSLLMDETQGAYYTWGASTVALLGCGLVFNCNPARGNTRGGVLNQAWLEYLGRRSYGLYLWHFPAFLWCDNLRPGLATGLVIAIAIVLSFVLTEFSWRLVERPFNRMRLRFSYRSNQA